jgi:hypothetical protein
VRTAQQPQPARNADACACCAGCSKSIRFGLMSNQEIQRVAEFHVFERNLYQMPQRAPLKNGILDPRLVRAARRRCRGAAA